MKSARKDAGEGKAMTADQEPVSPDLRKQSRQDQYIVALLENPTLEKAAAAVGVSAVTLWRAMQQPEFMEAYR